MKKVYNGKLPINARIKIDYRGEKAKVSFSYPDKKNQFRGNMLFPIIAVWAIILLIIFILPLSFQSIKTQVSYYINPNHNFEKCYDDLTDNYNDIRYSTCTQYAKNSSLYDTNYNLLYYITKTNLTFPFFVVYHNEFAVVKHILLILFGFGTPFIIYLLFKKRWDSLFPKWQAWLANKKYMKFTKDSEFKQDNYFEVPYFYNILLNYNATKEFSKYLDFIEIKEYPYYYFMKRNKKKKRINEWIWYARFYYSHKPKTGDLEVEFK